MTKHQNITGIVRTTQARLWIPFRANKEQKQTSPVPAGSEVTAPESEGTLAPPTPLKTVSKPSISFYPSNNHKKQKKQKNKNWHQRSCFLLLLVFCFFSISMRGPQKSKWKDSPKGSSSSSSNEAGEKKPTPKKKQMACKFFQQGNCKKGNACQFLHEVVAVAPAAVMAVPPPSSAPRVFLGDSDSNSNSALDDALTYACPFCKVWLLFLSFFFQEKKKKGSFSELELIVHLPDHQNENATQTCPICASLPGGDPNYKSQVFFCLFFFFFFCFFNRIYSDISLCGTAA
jgi:hypothetical protein